MRTRDPVEIGTVKSLYSNLLVEAVNTTTDNTTENALLVTAQCREVIIVATQTTSVPPRERHKNPGRTGGGADKGQKQAKAAPEKKKSMLKAGLG